MTNYPRAYRRIAEERLGRPLRPGEVVHHINGNRKDNRPENLQVLSSQAEHVRLHHTEWSGISDDHLKILILAGYRQRELIALGASSRRLYRLRRELGLPKGSRRYSVEAGTDTHKRGPQFDVEKARELRRQGLSYRAIAADLGVSHTTIRLGLQGGG